MTRFYDIDAANARLAQVRPILEQLRRDREELAAAQAEVERARRRNGSAEHARELRDRRARLRDLVRRMKDAVEQIDGWDITLRDIESGLVDFPALASGRQIWLCWRLGEAEIGWWHELETGFSARKPLVDLA